MPHTNTTKGRSSTAHVYTHYMCVCYANWMKHTESDFPLIFRALHIFARWIFPSAFFFSGNHLSQSHALPFEFVGSTHTHTRIQCFFLSGCCVCVNFLIEWTIMIWYFMCEKRRVKWTTFYQFYFIRPSLVANNSYILKCRHTKRNAQIQWKMKETNNSIRFRRENQQKSKYIYTYTDDFDMNALGIAKR